VTEPIVDILEAEWTALVTLGETFTEGDWDQHTDLPGWSVKDCFSHVAGTERSLAGEPTPEVDLSGLDHLTAPSAAFTEPAVAVRRPLAGAEVLADLREITGIRLATLRAMAPEEFDAVGWSPVGEVPHREFMAVRAFDCWMHEQDVRRALGRPGHQEGPVAEHSLGRCFKALGFVVGKKAAAPEGAVVVFELTGPMARTVTVTVRDGRAHTEEGSPSGRATATLTMAAEELWCLGGGRRDPDRALAEGLVATTGDDALAAAVVRSLNFMI
jgi:uncharacterized protein (TIGR03083 family)